MIEITDLTLQFGSKILFDSLQWMIPYGTKVALTGVNGAGKTTLLRCIMGQDDRYQGKIEIPGNPTIGFLPQELDVLSSDSLFEYIKKESGYDTLMVQFKEAESLFQKHSHDEKKLATIGTKYEHLLHRFQLLGGYSFESNVKKILMGLGFSQDDFSKKCTDFSGGWKMRIHLAKILFSSPDIMLLDEPTNHLDVASIEWLEQYLRTYEGTMIAISHDRMFLNHCIDKIAELSNCKIDEYPGNYDFYIHQSAQKREELIQEKQRQDEWIEKTTTFVNRFRYQATKASAVQSRIKMLEKMNRIEIDPPPKKISLRFPTCERSGLKSVEIVSVTKKYGDHVVLDSIDLTIERGEKVALVGKNGVGKSTLSRLMSKTEEPTTGKVIWGKNVHVGFYAQESAQNVNYEKTVWEEIQSIDTKANDLEKRTLLGAFLFTQEDLYKPITVLSGGEKSRLALCKMLLQPQNLLILDEPGNHLDIYTKEIFQRALMAYDGTLVIVSHDRFFLDQIASRIVSIENKAVKNYMGNYSYYVQKRKEQTALSETDQCIPNSPSSTSLFKNSNKESKEESARRTKEQKRLESEFRKKIQPYKDRIVELETMYEMWESKKKEAEERLCEKSTHQNPNALMEATQQLKDSELELALVIQKWEQAQREYEEVINTQP
ncbi:MAG: ATP-binding cassette domain-containing protein [Caldisericia bacterium]|nr:ATP-binding cassette domain-containing protein [Caldisericia bacterium]MDD4614606.1 ATP-binding cassette domain-containing protein [Caldisericia bacterium]